MAFCMLTYGERPQLSRRDRSPSGSKPLVAMNRQDHLRSHLTLSRQNGVTAEELIDDHPFGVLRGWPNAVTAIAVANEVFGGTDPQ